MKPPVAVWLAVKAPVRPEPILTVARSVADVLTDHVVFEVECIDWMLWGSETRCGALACTPRVLVGRG